MNYLKPNNQTQKGRIRRITNNQILISILTVLLITAFLFALSCKKEPKEIKIGAALPLTGGGSLYGTAAQKGIDMAIEEINAKGGIRERDVSVIYEDTQMEPQITTNVINKLITVNKVPVIIGPMASNTFLAVAPIAEKNKVVLISPSATSHVITDAGDYIFRTVVSDIYDGTAMAQFAYKKMGYRKVGVFYVNEAGPKGVTEAFVSEFENLGGEILVVETGIREGSDYRSQITKIKASNPNAVYFAGYAKESVIFLRQAKELGLKKQLMTHQVIDDPDVIGRAGEAADGVIFTTPKLTPELGGEAVRLFFEKFQKKYGEEPQNFAPNAYDAVRLIAITMEKHGFNPEGIKKGFYEVKNYQGASGEIKMDENGDVIQPMRIMTIEDGKVVPYGG